MTELKTFNDIKEEFTKDCVAKDFTESIIINKPLVGANAYYLDRLRQEAIKWVKELRFRRAYLEIPLVEYLEKSLLETERWIIWFFNIEEKELK